MTTGARAAARAGRDWITPLVGIALVVAVGVVLGLQYVAPDKRVLAVMVATIVVGVAWRLDLLSAIGLLVVALPYPRATVFGSTNLALILLLLIIWLLRLSTRSAPPPRRTPVDVPIIGLVLAYVISFYNLERSAHLVPAITNTVMFLGCLATFYLIVNAVRTSSDLRRLHGFQVFSIVTICLLGLYELARPGGVVIPGWIYFTHVLPGAIDVRNVRIGGPFFDFENLSDWAAINILLVGYLCARAKSPVARVLFGGLAALVAFILFATLTRGAMIALAVGVLYLAWLVRRHLTFVNVSVVSALLVVVFLAMNYVVANFTTSGDMIGRLLDPQTVAFKDGLPEGRAVIWQQAFERWMEHPLTGHGPYYSLQRGTTFWYWPHNLYLYVANLVGAVGLSFFLWLLLTLWRITYPKVRDLVQSSYAAGFLVIAHVQLLVFVIDQTKIEYLRNPTYQFQVWVTFAYMVAAARVAADERAAAGRAA
jgi:O-antigen ligase